MRRTQVELDERAGRYHDTQTTPRAAVMLERDGRYPPANELHAELGAIAQATTRGAARRVTATNRRERAG